MSLNKGNIYLCADGNIRRLDKIEEKYLYYSSPINLNGNRITWMDLGRTYRHQVEKDFINGKIINENILIKE